MKAGTPGFVGSRLTLARQLRGIDSIAGLSNRLGISRPAVSQFESGAATPSPAVFAHIQNTLNLPGSFFLKPVPVTQDTFRFRSWKTSKKGETDVAKAQASILHDIYEYLTTKVKFPELNLPPAVDIGNPSDLTANDIEQIAIKARGYWDVAQGPLSNVVMLLENSGLVVARVSLHSKRIDAFSFWSEGNKRPFVVNSADRTSSVRSRFSHSHEIGHLLLHSKIKTSSYDDKETVSLMEKQAHQFASSFLMPAEEFSNDFYSASLQALLVMKAKWRVSLGAMIIRATQLKLITDRQNELLWMNLSKRGWRTQEPLDDRISHENPRFLERCFSMLKERGKLSENSYVKDLGLYESEITSLLRL